MKTATLFGRGRAFCSSAVNDLHEVAQAVFEQAGERVAFLDDEAAHHATARLPAMTPTALSLGYTLRSGSVDTRQRFERRIGDAHHAEPRVTRVVEVGGARHDAVTAHVGGACLAGDGGVHVGGRGPYLRGQAFVVAGGHVHLVAQQGHEFACLVRHGQAANLMGIRPVGRVAATAR